MICTSVKRTMTWGLDQPRLLRMWSCSGKRSLEKMEMRRKRSNATLINPVPPLTSSTPDTMKIRNGFPDLMTRMPSSSPTARDPASPMRSWLGWALYHR